MQPVTPYPSPIFDKHLAWTLVLISDPLGSVPGDITAVPLTNVSFRILFDFPLLIAIAVLLHNQLQP